MADDIDEIMNMIQNMETSVGTNSSLNQKIKPERHNFR